MDIDGKLYCSRCMRQIEEETVCPFCQYDHKKERNNSSALERGTLLKERYQIGSVIGQGGFGITYAAWDETLDIPVAVKEYFPAYFVTRNTEYGDEVIVAENNRRQYLVGRQHFLRESRVLAMMKGLKGVVSVQDYFEENETAYIVMEYIQGVSLGEYARKQRLEGKKLFEMLKDPIDALIALHKQGVLHRDITPSNLLVQEDGSVKLIDFGSAAKMKQDQSMVVVTQQYAPVEQYQSQDSHLGAWTDVYGLTATIYEVLTGIVPQESIARMHKDELAPLEQTGLKLKSYQSKAIMQGLIVSPEKRTQSMEEFRSRLYHLPLPEEIQMRKRFMRKVGIFSAASVLLILLWAANFTTGFPLGSGLRYVLRMDGWHIVDARIEDEISLTVPKTRLGIPVVAMEAYALADCVSLREVYLPDHLAKIVGTAFEGTSRYLTVWGEKGSLAEAAVKSAGLSFHSREDFEIQEIGDGTVTLAAYNGEEECLKLPSVIEGKKVTALLRQDITNWGFGLPDTVKELHFPEEIEVIPWQFDAGSILTYESSANVEKLRFNEKLKVIENSAFYVSDINEIEFSDGLEIIGDYAFARTNLEELNLPEGIKELGEGAFHASKIREIRFPSTVESWGIGVLDDCDRLEIVHFPDNMETIPKGMFYDCDALTDIIISESVRTIGERAFATCDSLEVVEIPEGVLTLEDEVFINCYHLKYVDIPESVTQIGEYVFSGCSPELVIAGYAGSAAQKYAQENNITFEEKDRWSELVQFTYAGCVNLINEVEKMEKSIILPTYDEENHTLVHTVDEYMIRKNEHGESYELEYVQLPLFAEKIGGSAFIECPSLKEVEIPDQVRLIGEMAFYDSGIENIVIPDSVVTMEGYEFSNCKNLKNAVIGSSVEMLYGTFEQCENLEDVYIRGKDTWISENTFEGCGQVTIHGYPGAWAELFAEEKGFSFEIIQ